MVVEAARVLMSEFAVACEVWSATSYGELARDAAAVERRNRLNPTSAPSGATSRRRLTGKAPIIAASDYVRAYPQLIAPYVEAPFTALGTDGFGRSDTRSALRRFFEVDAANIVVAVLYALAKEGDVSVANGLCGHRAVRLGFGLARAMDALRRTSGQKSGELSQAVPAPAPRKPRRLRLTKPGRRCGGRLPMPKAVFVAMRRRQPAARAAPSCRGAA